MTRERNEYALTAAERMRLYRARQRGDVGASPKRKPGPRPAPKTATIPAHPGVDRGYPLDFISPVRHVATELERAGTRGATIRELADSYNHVISSDLARVQRSHGLDSEYQATRFLVDRAISALGGQVRPARGQGRWRLAVPFDDLRHEGDELVRSS